jgi:hypothetical protein
MTEVISVTVEVQIEGYAHVYRCVVERLGVSHKRHFFLLRHHRAWEERKAVLTTAADDPNKIQLAFVDSLGDTDL